MKLIHRCVECRHPQDFHSAWSRHGDRCSYGACPCLLGATQIDTPSEFIPTYGVGGSQVDHLVEPGRKQTWEGPGTCGCDQCREIYRAVLVIRPELEQKATTTTKGSKA